MNGTLTRTEKVMQENTYLKEEVTRERKNKSHLVTNTVSVGPCVFSLDVSNRERRGC